MSATLLAPSLSEYVPTTDAPARLAEGLRCIVEGRPFPAHLAPTTYVAPAPVACVEDGLARLLRAPGA